MGFPVDDRRTILKAAFNMLGHVDGDDPAAFEITLRNKLTGTTIHIEPQDNELAISELPEAQQLILDQFMPGQTLNNEQVCKLTGYKNNTNLRNNLKQLRDAGFLTKTDDGHMRASTPPGDPAKNHLADANCSTGGEED